MGKSTKANRARSKGPKRAYNTGLAPTSAFRGPRGARQGSYDPFAPPPSDGQTSLRFARARTSSSSTATLSHSTRDEDQRTVSSYDSDDSGSDGGAQTCTSPAAAGADPTAHAISVADSPEPTTVEGDAGDANVEEVPGVDAFEVSSDLCAVLFGEANPSDGYSIRCFKVSINKNGEDCPVIKFHRAADFIRTFAIKGIVSKEYASHVHYHCVFALRFPDTSRCVEKLKKFFRDYVDVNAALGYKVSLNPIDEGGTESFDLQVGYLLKDYGMGGFEYIAHNLGERFLVDCHMRYQMLADAQAEGIFSLKKRTIIPSIWRYNRQNFGTFAPPVVTTLVWMLQTDWYLDQDIINSATGMALDLDRADAYFRLGQGHVTEADVAMAVFGISDYQRPDNSFPPTLEGYDACVEYAAGLEPEMTEARRSRMPTNGKFVPGTHRDSTVLDTVLSDDVVAELRLLRRRRVGSTTNVATDPGTTQGRRCSRCQQTGHNVRTCPNNNQAPL